MTTERKPNPIIRREKFVVASKEMNNYADLLVTSQGGNIYKIGNKRPHLFDVFQDGVEVVVGYSSYKEREYIAEAVQAQQLVSADTKIEEEKPPEVNPVRPISGEERGMFWKELGNRIGDGSLDKDFPKSAVAIKGQYYKKMSEITGVTFKPE